MAPVFLSLSLMAYTHTRPSPPNVKLNLFKKRESGGRTKANKIMQGGEDEGGPVYYLDGHGLLEVLEETVGLELVEVAAGGLLVGVELDALGDELPELLGVILGRAPEPADGREQREKIR
jgi:hypothetical protein